jgi:hypothetical protein
LARYFLSSIENTVLIRLGIDVAGDAEFGFFTTREAQCIFLKIERRQCIARTQTKENAILSHWEEQQDREKKGRGYCWP